VVGPVADHEPAVPAVADEDVGAEAEEEVRELELTAASTAAASSSAVRAV
jgi:hypothetical protein